MEHTVFNTGLVPESAQGAAGKGTGTRVDGLQPSTWEVTAREVDMIQVLAGLTFSGAAAVAGGTIYGSVAPQWRRILRLAGGQTEAVFAPLSQLALAERRIAVRRWSAASRPLLDCRAAA